MLVQGLLFTPIEAARVTNNIDKIRVTWDSVPNAVMYELVITDGKSAKIAT